MTKLLAVHAILTAILSSVITYNDWRAGLIIMGLSIMLLVLVHYSTPKDNEAKKRT